uniref:UDENN FLCN/SMCR8-type domain-containing protein n=1 Tax=Knipowitschia caucasica TaxID=637954 RepID=A0AAV2KFQ2_KNICA
MIGSPDVVAFTKEEDYGQSNPEPWPPVPEEFSIPLYPPVDSNPWAKTSYAKFTKDFILISEFSEQVGPQPLLTIPDEPKVCGTFDLNYFSLRIMSVDYQASFVGHPPGSAYPRLSFVEDSRVVLGDSKEGAFAYVHHLTLYDLEARGFVRPFCMAYVSADERKIMLQFQELSLRFSQASECLKAGNRRAFAKELQRKLQDLEYTHSVLQQEEGIQREAGLQTRYSAHAVEKANELANVEKSIYEHRDLLKQITSYHQRPRRDPHAATCHKCMKRELGLSESQLESSPSDQTQDSSEETKASYSIETNGTKQRHNLDSDLTPDHERESSSEDMETTVGDDEGDNGDHTPLSLLEPNGGCEEDCESDISLPIDTCCMSQDGFIYEDLSVGPAKSHPNTRAQPPQTLVVNQEPQALHLLQDQYTVGSPLKSSALELPVGQHADSVSHVSVEDGSDCTMSASTGSDRAVSPMGYGGMVTSRQKKKAGQGALRFVRQYPFAMQALWCLLSGRTLVVFGEDEGRVRKLVSALALFLPGSGKCAERVQTWISGPFSLTDIYRWKLIGLQRISSPLGSSTLYSLSRYSRYISILDIDQKTLHCPPYRGQLLSNIADHRTYIRRGSTYFLHLQSMLCQLAAKAFLLTFTHHLHLPVSSEEGPEVVLGRRLCFLQEQLGLCEEDCQIMLYLSQLITQYYLNPSSGSSSAPQCFSFKYTTSVLYKI